MRKHHKKNMPLLLGLLLSTGVFTILGATGRGNIYKEYGINLWKEPVLTVMFEGIKDGVYPWKMIYAASVEESSELLIDEGEDVVSSEVIEMNHKASENKEPKEEAQEVFKVETPKQEEVNKEQIEESIRDSIEQEEKQESSETPQLGEVTQDYFDDVLFIGDSRTVGLSEYSYLTNATYYSDVGLSVYTVFDKKIAKMGHKMVTLEEALEKKKYKKIYIMLGVNELGTGTAKTFAKKYEEMLNRIQELEPDAYIVVQAIMKVGKKLSDSDPIYNNPNIVERNEELAKLADQKKIFYLDVNEVLSDEEGYLPDEHTFDSIHLLGMYYDIWADYLMSHGIIEK